MARAKLKDMQCDIRFAQEQDVATIIALAQELAEYEGEEITLSEAGLLRDGFDESPAFSILVAEMEGRVVGFVLFYPGYDLASATRGSHMGDLIVTRAYRRQGIGRVLTAALAEETLRRGAVWVSFTVLKKNRLAKEFYQSLEASAVDVNFMAWGEKALKNLCRM